MENTEFLGEYTMKPDARRDLLPVQHGDGLWQAWRMQEGNIMIQALNEEKEAWGTLYLMEEQEFLQNFLPFQGPQGRRVRADAPDLLSMWYEQAKADPFQRERNHHSSNQTEPRPADSPWLDSFFNEEDHHAHGGSESAPTGAAPASRTVEPVVRVAKDAETLAGEHEMDMRASFAAVSEALQREEPQALDDLTRLISRPGAYTWKQKYMFTEFGLALRKLHRPAEALACHRRALSLSPKDEHVLFNVARSEYEMGNLPAAKAYLAESIAAAPDFDAARNFLDFLNSGGKL